MKTTTRDSLPKFPSREAWAEAWQWRWSKVGLPGCPSHESLGRRLVEGEKLVRIHSEKVAVKAKIHTLGGSSAHARRKDLLAWFPSLAPCKPRQVLAHGADGPRETLAKLLRQRYGIKAALPRMGESISL